MVTGGLTVILEVISPVSHKYDPPGASPVAVIVAFCPAKMVWVEGTTSIVGIGLTLTVIFTGIPIHVVGGLFNTGVTIYDTEPGSPLVVLITSFIVFPFPFPPPETSVCDTSHENIVFGNVLFNVISTASPEQISGADNTKIAAPRLLVTLVETQLKEV